MVAGVGLEPHDLLVMSPVVVPPRPQSRRAATKSLLFQNSPMGVAPAEAPYLGGTLEGSLHNLVRHRILCKYLTLHYIILCEVNILGEPSRVPYIITGEPLKGSLFFIFRCTEETVVLRHVGGNRFF